MKEKLNAIVKGLDIQLEKLEPIYLDTDKDIYTPTQLARDLQEAFGTLETAICMIEDLAEKLGHGE